MKIIYPTESGIAIIFPTGELPIEEVARKDVPPIVRYEGTGEFYIDEETDEILEVMQKIVEPRPYLLIDDADIPTGVPQEAWEADFSNPDGYGIGAEAWFAEQKAKRAVDEAAALRALYDNGGEDSHGKDHNQQR